MTSPLSQMAPVSAAVDDQIAMEKNAGLIMGVSFIAVPRWSYPL